MAIPPLALGLLLFQLLTGSGALSGLALLATLTGGVLLISPSLRILSSPLSLLVGPMRAIGESFEHFVSDRLLATRRGDLIVESAFDLGADKLRLSESLLEEVRSVPGVKSAGAEVNAKSLAPETGVLAVDANRLLDSRFGDWGPEATAEARQAVAEGRAFLVNAQLVTSRKARVGEPLTLTSTVTDDGIPKRRTERSLPSAAAAGATPTASGEGGGEAAAAPRRNPMMLPPARITVGKNVGLHHAFYVFRGSGEVTFSPAQIKVWEDTRAGANSP